MNTLIKQHLLIIGFFIIAVWGCKEDPGLGNEIEKRLWVSSQEFVPTTPVTADFVKNSLSAMSLVDQGNLAHYTSMVNMVKYDVKFYRVKYKTKFQGDTINASGLICVPVSSDKKDRFPIMSFQHGTISKKSDAPSVNPMMLANSMIAYVASTGMIVLMPDYIGFGESSQHFHPYLHKEYTTNAILDFIRAGKEFVLLDKPAQWNEKIFLAGYSQGGSATLGALNAIENNPANSDIVVTASSCGAGAYSLVDFREWLVNQMKPGMPGRYEQPWLLLYVMESFSKYANVSTPYAAIFKENIAPLVPGVIDGVKSSVEINSQFSQYIGNIFTTEFLDNSIYQSSAVFAPLKSAFEANSISAWALRSKLRIYYGQNDVWVPAQLSINITGEFQSAGASANLSARPLAV